ncbi:MAG: DUF2971 domain-containing protein [Verrucomicrobiales bacterium]|nr:DUF2971 domain-containing protein [Verrucomicrobiales bacterium]
MILYKYLPPERVDVLEHGLIAFTPPRLFNDPFEASPIFPSDAPEAIELHDEQLTKRVKFTHAEKIELQRKIDAIQSAHGYRRLIVEQAVNSVGVLCLSEKKDCALMWAHYTAQHTGFVIGIDTAHQLWVESVRKNGGPGEPIKLIYSNERPKPKCISDVTPEQIWYTKSKEWEYENEWRTTRWNARAFTTIKNPVGEDIPLHEFPREAITEVILGQRIESFTELQILQLVYRPPFETVLVLRAELDQTTFGLNIVPR